MASDNKGIVGEFKEFISQGSVLDMAVGIIIGAAFTAIVTSLVENIVMPIIGVLIGGLDFSALAVTIGSAEIQYGLFIQAVINFLLIALVIFLLVRSINKLRRVEPEEDAPEEPGEDVVLLREIRDELKRR